MDNQLIKPEQVSTKYLLHTLFNLSVDLNDSEKHIRYYTDDEGYLREEVTSVDYCSEKDTIHILVDPFIGKMPVIHDRSNIDGVDIADFIHESLEIDGLDEKIEIAFQDLSNYLEDEDDDLHFFDDGDSDSSDY
jgi:hypothetical protein